MKNKIVLDPMMMALIDSAKNNKKLIIKNKKGNILLDGSVDRIYTREAAITSGNIKFMLSEIGEISIPD